MTTSASASPASSRATAPALLVLAVILSGLFYYKWGASLRAVGAVQTTGKLAISPGTILDGSVIATTVAYFRKIWLALVYGILIGAVVRAAVPASWVRRWLGGRGGRPTVTAALTGAPLMLCSCCITPVFSGLYQRGARLGPSLAVMLASPGLNVAALVLTFALLPARVGIVRVVAALLIVLGLSSLVGRTLEGSARAPNERCNVDEPDQPLSWRAFLSRLATSAVYLLGITVPLIVAGVLLSGLLLPHVTRLTSASTIVAVASVALIGTLAALPTFFEIPIALLLLSVGAPVPVVIAFVVAGPVVNLPSLLVLGREAGPRVAFALAAGVWLVATASGWLAMV